jgi:hypothetical protein
MLIDGLDLDYDGQIDLYEGTAEPIYCSELIGAHQLAQDYNPAQHTFHRVAPGDMVIKNGHVALVNYITGERGNDQASDPNKRDGSDIFLVQAISQRSDRPNAYADGRLDGRVTDTWTWDSFGRNARLTYKARRLLP